MKYFTAIINGEEAFVGGATDAKRYMKAHPECESLTRYWWSHDDLIEVEDYSREDLLGKNIKQIEAGQTVSWAYGHGAMEAKV